MLNKLITIWPAIRRSIMCRKSNRKSQKLCPLHKMMKNLSSISNPIKYAFSILLTLSTLGKIFSRHFEIFLLFFPENRTICMKCQILFFWKKYVNITNLPSAELAQRVVMVMRHLCTGNTFLVLCENICIIISRFL